jgi:nitrite reductase (NADH) small subunit/3-phenylpropionate/trans-cinnamate dioxygenase ferredoxin subunit
MPQSHKVATVSELPPGAGRLVEVGGQRIALFNVGGTIHAVSDTCPHRGASLSEGALAGNNITCPWHGWTFDVTTGHRVGFPAGMGATQCFKVSVVGDDVILEC